jgi:Na+-transporting NADH:ubiquinone oxidoreductase subunit B
MITVVVALLPAFLFGMWNVGHQYNHVNQIEGATFLSDIIKGAWYVLPIVFVSYLVGGICEVTFSIIRKHEINEGFLVTGLLFPLTMPPDVPLWQVAAGIAFGTVIGKEIFGGTGFNFLNPALTARAFCFFAFPAKMSGEIWTVVKDGATTVQGWTAATPLAVAAAAPNGDKEMLTIALADAGYSLKTMFSGIEGGSIAETGFIPIAIGAVILILTGVGSWRIMVGGVVGLFLAATVLDAVPDDGYLAFFHLGFMGHLMIGSFMFGIVFMATDPVSAAATDTGKWIYGILIGVLTVLIRVTNPAYPEGVMLSILFMNAMAPLIDHYVVRAHINKRKDYIRKFKHAEG